jgi:hypothetical protein
MLSVVMLNVANKPFKWSVIMLNVFMLSVVAPPVYKTELVTAVKSFVAPAPGFH